MLDHHTEEDRPATAAEAIREMAYSVAHPESALCGCKGSGWLLSDWDSWTPCPSHPGHPHPEADYDEDPIETLRVRYSNARETIKAYGYMLRPGLRGTMPNAMANRAIWIEADTDEPEDLVAAAERLAEYCRDRVDAKR